MDFPIENNRILKWVRKIKNEDTSLKSSMKSLIRDFSNIWNNDHYQKRSPLINESTFTHDILAPVLKFIAPDYFKRWDQNFCPINGRYSYIWKFYRKC